MQKRETLHTVISVCLPVLFSLPKRKLTSVLDQIVCTCLQKLLSQRSCVSMCVCMRACVQQLVLSHSCLMFYALLSESDDDAADSPLSGQPLISITRSFNLLSFSVYTLLSPLSKSLLCLLSLAALSSFLLLQNCVVFSSFYAFFMFLGELLL